MSSFFEKWHIYTQYDAECEIADGDNKSGKSGKNWNMTISMKTKSFQEYSFLAQKW